MPTATTPTIPIDLLGATNAILAAIGQAEIASILTADLKSDAAKAITKIGQASITVQTMGWEYNTDRGLVLDPSPTDGTIALPTNCLAVKTVGNSKSTHVAKRGGRLYLPKTQTFVIGQSLTVDMVVALEFSDLPPAARWYVTCLAGRRFATTELASSSSFQFTKVEEDAAKAAALQEDADMGDSDMGQTSPHIAFMRRR